MNQTQRDRVLEFFSQAKKLQGDRKAKRLGDARAGLALLKAAASARAERLSHQRASPNVFHVLGLQNREEVPARLVAWLLDPQGTHGLGTRVLLDFVTRLLRKRPQHGREALIRILNDSSLWSTAVYREESEGGDRVDILVHAPMASLVIEVKMASSEHNQQTRRYARRYRRAKGTAFVYLAPSGAPPPSSAEFIGLSYDDLCDTVVRALADYDVHEGTVSILQQFVSLLREWG
ncbi:MAG TPA: PD-(D/E)XK nuclease family protein [Polyangiaceae bacterium LLY-WYZ-15_(1-7)]|nr:hypothetical protein [Sandaracinus sp.]HJK94039.1 PD-(D/E)XK nuclease family protein [Polyangiaceae bacterium LLY-WYZ-15_(1-7)]MBJ71393.1 hypothetical protein [Sandaracinus sp.]HJL06471.1 PD-(D/E)XK nuclease family protein [Polyangiaceae bacterium LLY-WYZ-15_(1-7)]HJL12341.1 PD-(D/E)XK nuclease family protein [Polyangiaceae bacterium LLY-WYZ-15_(1-7)]